MGYSPWGRKESDTTVCVGTEFSSLNELVLVLSCSIMSDSLQAHEVAHQAPLSTGFSRQEYRSELPFPSPRDLPNSGIKPTSPVTPALAGRFFTSEPPGRPSQGIQIVTSVAQSCLTLKPHGLQHARLPCPSPAPTMLKLMSIESVMPSNHLILCHPLLLLPPIFPSIRVFSNESALCIRWPKYWSFSFSISPSNEYSGLLGLTGLISLQFK